MGGLVDVFAVGFASLSGALFALSVLALYKRRLLGGPVTFLLGLLILALSGLFGVTSAGVQGYRVLTRESLVALVETQPLERQWFRVKFRFPDGRTRQFELAGDELYVDAHILKWKPIANLLGLHTAYELDRVAGRYADIEDERSKTRTVFSLAQEKPVDLFRLRREYPFWGGPFVDAEYGSATFIPAAKAGRYELRISTTGLLIRDLEEEDS